MSHTTQPSEQLYKKTFCCAAELPGLYLGPVRISFNKNSCTSPQHQSSLLLFGASDSATTTLCCRCISPSFYALCPEVAVSTACG